MMTTPQTKDVRNTREQALHALHTAIEQVRTSLLAALGAGELATHAVVDVVNKARVRVSERAEATRGAVGDLPTDLAGLRERLDSAELRKLVDEYTEAAHQLYQKLAGVGEDTVARWRAQPQVRKALDQLEEAIATLQERVGDVAGDARELADDVLARVTHRTRSAGERAAKTAQKVASDTAGAVIGAGNEVAQEIRSKSRKIAAKTAPDKAPTESGATKESTDSTAT
jgi:heparin binding hemagglutinin HbhA